MQLQAQQEKTVIRQDLAQYFDAYGLEGSFILFDQKDKQWISFNPARNEQGYLPASTFKILNTLIALEAGLVQDSSTLLPWNGTVHWNQQWNRDLSLGEAFTVSCVPCYREIARKIGLSAMRHWVQRAGYGHMQIDENNLDLFWLAGNSRISPREQVLFLRSLFNIPSPFRSQSLEVLRQIMLREEGELYKIFGKTGLVTHNDLDIGWYVGYAEARGNRYYFALNIEKDAAQEDPEFTNARVQITHHILKALHIL